MSPRVTLLLAFFLLDASAQVPLRFDRNGIPIAPVTVNGHALEVGVDTGAGMTVLSETSAQRAGVRELRASDVPVLDALGQRIPARMGTADVEVAGVRLRNLQVLVVPDERLRAATSWLTMFHFDGLLGWNAMQAHRVTIDYGARELRFDIAGRDCGAVNLWSGDSRPLVAFEADGVAGRALLDTGARTSMLVAPHDGEQSRLVAGASGVATRREGIRHGVTLMLGGQRFERLSLPVAAPGEHATHSALVGNDLLAGRRVDIDATCGRFTVGPVRQ